MLNHFVIEVFRKYLHSDMETESLKQNSEMEVKVESMAVVWIKVSKTSTMRDEKL